MDFGSHTWRPLPRPAGTPAPTRVVRIDDGIPPAQAMTSAPQVLYDDGERARVRMCHHAPGAQVVALAASGWWRVDPPDACDLRFSGNGWFEGTFEVPSGWIASYGFAEHDGEGDPPWWHDGFRSVPVVPDPANRHQHGAGRGGVRSVVQVPRNPFTSAAASADAVPSEKLPTADDEPRVSWWAPESSADGTEQLPLVVFFDGQGHVDGLGTPSVLARLVEEGVLPPLAAVFVHVGSERPAVLGVPGGQARWVAETLLPRLHETGLVAQRDTRGEGTGRISVDPAATIVTGASFGGLSALFTACHAPQQVATVIAQSTSLWRYPPNALVEPLAAASAAAPLRLRLQAGTFEGPAAAHRLTSQLNDRDVDATTTEVPGGHDWAWWLVHAVRELARTLQPRTYATRADYP